MDSTILAVNCGSSSIKFKLFASPALKVLISGQASSVASKGEKPTIKFTVHEDGHDEQQAEEEAEDMPYEAVFERIISLLESSALKYFTPNDDPSAPDIITAVAHRVVHGGTETEPMDIYAGHTEGLDRLDALSDFAPLHNHRAIQVIKYCLEHLPRSHQILCFDTLFHASLPPQVYTYPLSPPKQEAAIPLRKYGAHGLSYAYILRSMSNHLKKPEEDLNLIVAHLGSGASVCLIKNGKSYDTSMGLSPLEGLPGGTRTGSVDPVLIFHHTPNASETVEFNGLPVARGEMVLNKEGGIAALAGTSNFGTIISQYSSSPKHKIAYDVFLDRLLNFIGSYLLKLFGSSNPPPELHGVIFSGGIGERAAKLRKDVGDYLSWLGCVVDEQANHSGVSGDVGDGVKEISVKGESKTRLFICLTDEESQTASMALRIMQEKYGIH